tara:strand:+ start:339 stop:806 length:468 start_codon:yes stop_codon:yes gene_type:complete
MMSINVLPSTRCHFNKFQKMAGLKRKREEKNESSEEEEVTAWTIDDLKLNDRQEAILKMKGNNQLKHICKWARRSEEFRDNSETPEYCGNGVIGDYAASDFIKSLYDTGKYAPTTHLSYVRIYFQMRYGVRDGKNVYSGAQAFINRVSCNKTINI